MIPLTRANITSAEINAVTKVLKSGWLTMGPETEKFEEEFAKYVGSKYAVAVNSATSALFLALQALGIKKGDEVIVPSFTFASSVNVIVHSGATPVFADIKMDDFTIDQKSLDKLITKKTKAVIPVHYAANRAMIKTNLPIIEDSAHLIPKNGDNKNSFVRCYSFYATKNLTTGEGGMITTNDEKVANWLKQARLHGLSRDAWKRYSITSKWTYTVEFAGFKFNTTDLNSALGRVQLKRLDTFEKRRREVVALYNKLLGLNNKGTHLYPVLIDNRDKFFAFMKEQEVGCSFHFTPLHLEPAFKKYAKGKLPVTEYVGSRVVTLPLDAVVTNKEVEKVAGLVKQFLEENPNAQKN
jgi:dTDP-4-amino-4,6-dideoxygalactose transaminase